MGSFFTSFLHPVMIVDKDADMLEGVLQKIDLSKGLVLVLNSPGGDILAAERIINVCRSYSETDEYWVIIPGKAKSAATIISFGASKIIMGSNSELGPVDPQIIISEEGKQNRFSAYNIVNSYENLFQRAVKSKGRLKPFLQQLQRYDEREIAEYKAYLELSQDIAIRTLKSGMMSVKSESVIKKKIETFLTPKRTKTHGRPIYRDEAKQCGLNIESADVKSDLWKLVYELYIRTDNYVSGRVSKCIESIDHSFVIHAAEG